MKLCIDNNRLLCASQTQEDGKEYTQDIQDYIIKSYDKTLFVSHKKNIKTIQFKEIWERMSAFFITNRSSTLWNEPLTLHHTGAMSGLMFYKWYDEERDSNYAFLYKYPTNNVNVLNTQLQLLGVDAHVNTTEKWLIVSSDITKEPLGEKTTDIQAIMSYLFVLTLLYGKMDVRASSLMGIKIHMHLFWSYLKEQQVLDTMLYFLQGKGLFLQKSIIESNDGIVYQISSSDYEVLSWFAQLYKSIAKIDKIPTFDKTIQTKNKLVAYIQSLIESWDIMDENNTLDLVKNRIVKCLTK